MTSYVNFVLRALSNKPASARAAHTIGVTGRFRILWIGMLQFRFSIRDMYEIVISNVTKNKNAKRDVHNTFLGMLRRDRVSAKFKLLLDCTSVYRNCMIPRMISVLLRNVWSLQCGDFVARHLETYFINNCFTTI